VPSPAQRSTLFPYTTLFRSHPLDCREHGREAHGVLRPAAEVERPALQPADVGSHQQVGGDGIADMQHVADLRAVAEDGDGLALEDRKSTRLNSSHVKISYAV